MELEPAVVNAWPEGRSVAHAEEDVHRRSGGEDDLDVGLDVVLEKRPDVPDAVAPVGDEVEPVTGVICARYAQERASVALKVGGAEARAEVDDRLRRIAGRITQCAFDGLPDGRGSLLAVSWILVAQRRRERVRRWTQEHDRGDGRYGHDYDDGRARTSHRASLVASHALDGPPVLANAFDPMLTVRPAPFCYFAYSTARVSRMTVTLICPGYCIVSWIFCAMSRESRAVCRSSSLSGFTTTRTSRPAWIANDFSTPSKLFATLSSSWSRWM